MAIFLTDYSETERSLIIRDTEVFKLLYQNIITMICLGSKNEPVIIDQVIELIETEKPIITKETRMGVKPMRDLREELARLVLGDLIISIFLFSF